MDFIIYKYELIITDLQTVLLPEGAQILHIAEQNEKLCMWAKVQTGVGANALGIRIVGTGNPMPEEFGTEVWNHFTTVIMSDGIFVWHVYLDRQS